MDITLLESIKPKVLVVPKAYQKIWMLVDRAPKEVGWLGKVRDLGKHQYVIEDIYLFDQEVTGSETEIDEEALGKFFHEYFDIAETIRFWGHSHVNMTVGPSKTDTDQMETFIENGAEYFLMGIYNKKRDVRFDIYTQNYIIKNVPYTLYLPEDEEMKQALEDEFILKVKDKSYAKYDYSKDPYGYGNGYGKPLPPAAGVGTGHSQASGNVRSTKPPATTGRRDWNGSHRQQGSHVTGKVGTKRLTVVGRGHSRTTQSSQSDFLN